MAKKLKVGHQPVAENEVAPFIRLSPSRQRSKWLAWLFVLFLLIMACIFLGLTWFSMRLT